MEEAEAKKANMTQAKEVAAQKAPAKVCFFCFMLFHIVFVLFLDYFILFHIIVLLFLYSFLYYLLLFYTHICAGLSYDPFPPEATAASELQATSSQALEEAAQKRPPAIRKAHQWGFTM